jgi:hypothetical protein
MKIPSYKYKFKQMLKKIYQVKLLIFYFVAVPTRTMKVKYKHISVGLSYCQTIGLRNQWAVGISDCRIIATLSSWTGVCNIY